MESDTNAYQEATVLVQSASKAWVDYMEAVSNKTPTQPFESAIADSVPPGLYEHWKSRDGDLKFYVVYGAGVQQDVHAALTGYASLYGAHCGKITFRNLLDDKHGFLVPINTPIDRPDWKPVYVGPRFTLIEKLDAPQLGALIAHAERLAKLTDRDEFLAAALGPVG